MPIGTVRKTDILSREAYRSRLSASSFPAAERQDFVSLEWEEKRGAVSARFGDAEFDTKGNAMSSEPYQEALDWRHHIHENPELGFDVGNTASFVVSHLKRLGCDEIIRDIGGTSVVGMINGAAGDGRTIALRAELDALPIEETGSVAWRSQIPGRMHACGHDGHMAMLLGAARLLAESRNFAGHVALIFQPAEEKGGGGREMVKAGLMERCSIDAVYGMHNMPGLPVGRFSTRPGALMAETAEFDIHVIGRGGHAAHPNETVDPILIAAEITLALQSIASRAADPRDAVVVSITRTQGGSAYNIIPTEVVLSGTIRSLRRADTEMAVRKLKAICEGCAAMHGGIAKVVLHEGYPITFNSPEQTRIACTAAAEIVGADNVDANARPSLGSEDFSFMLEARPGAMILIGNGDTVGLHHPAYDFNDEAIPHGIRYWCGLIAAELGA